VKLGPIHIAIPDQWEDRSMYAFVAPATRTQVGLAAKGDTFRTNVVLTWSRVDANTDLEQRAALARRRIEAGHPNVTITAGAGPIVGGRPSKSLRYTIAGLDAGPPVLQIQYVVLLDGVEAIVTFSTSTSATPDQLEALEGIISSMVLER
jgi:hypothetical protein